MNNEGPSSEDLDRFGGDTAYCPECGEEVWDDADVCPHCHQPMLGDHAGATPVQKSMQYRTTVIIVVLVILGLLACYRTILM